MGHLGHVVARITTTEVLIFKRHKEYVYRGKRRSTIKDCITFIGDRTDVAVASAIYKILIKSCHHWVKEEIGPGYGRAQRCYCEGFVDALWVKVNRVKPDTETTALVLSDKKDQISKFVQENLNPTIEDKNTNRKKDHEEARYMGFMRGLEQNIPNRNSVE
jgi:hypothetical protein